MNSRTNILTRFTLLILDFMIHASRKVRPEMCAPNVDKHKGKKKPDDLTTTAPLHSTLSPLSTQKKKEPPGLVSEGRVIGLVSIT
jgi:hypothetical protein